MSDRVLVIVAIPAAGLDVYGGRGYRTLELGTPPASAPACLRCPARASLELDVGHLCRRCLNELVGDELLEEARQG